VLWVTGNGRDEDYFAALHLAISSFCVLIPRNQHLKASHERFKEVICFKGCLFYKYILEGSRSRHVGTSKNTFFSEGGGGFNTQAWMPTYVSILRIP
jgi:hypothetical protein